METEWRWSSNQKGCKKLYAGATEAPRYTAWSGGDMPTALRIGSYRFHFYANDRGEPPQVHVERDDATAKFWLSPVRFQRGRGFGRRETSTAYGRSAS